MPKQHFKADGLFSLTFLYTVVAYLSAHVRSINRSSTQRQKVRPIKEVYLMAYQA